MFWILFGSKRNPSDLEPKKVQKRGFLAKKMVPPASRTFWEHGASEHLMVLGKIAKKNVFSQEKKWFLTDLNDLSHKIMSLDFALHWDTK